MKNFLQFVMIWSLLAGVCGCSAQSSESAATTSAKFVIPSGTLIKVVLIDALGTNTSSPGDHFSASLAEPIVIGGKTLLEKGTQVRGRVFDLRESGIMNAKATLRLMLNEIMYEDKRIAIRTENFQATASPYGGKDIRFNAKARLDFVLATEVEIWAPDPL
jgi:hypothetical protein